MTKAGYLMCSVFVRLPFRTLSAQISGRLLHQFVDSCEIRFRIDTGSRAMLGAADFNPEPETESAQLLKPFTLFQCR